MFTFNSNDWYYHTKEAGGDATYPMTVGDIKVTGYGYALGTSQAFPTTMPNYYYAGDISFKFKKD